MLLTEFLIELPSWIMTIFTLITNGQCFKMYDETSNTLSKIIKEPGRDTSLMEPTYDTSFDRNVTVMVGQTAFFECFIKDLNEKTVSWVRHEDVHIVSTGTYLYTADDRFVPLHPRPEEGREEYSKWVLRFTYVQKRDEGIYECQISTKPIKALQYELHVVVPKPLILGPEVRYVSAGKTFTLTCVVYYTTMPTSYFFWYLNNEVIVYNASRLITLRNIMGPNVSHSILKIRKAKTSQSGTYRCLPNNTPGYEVKVIVTNATVAPTEPPVTEDLPEELISQMKNHSKDQDDDVPSAGNRPQNTRIGFAGFTIALECLTVCLILICKAAM